MVDVDYVLEPAAASSEEGDYGSSSATVVETYSSDYYWSNEGSPAKECAAVLPDAELDTG